MKGGMTIMQKYKHERGYRYIYYHPDGDGWRIGTHANLAGESEGDDWFYLGEPFNSILALLYRIFIQLPI